jgi:2-polyprenyl-6-methoxyphenol hydroxylase-like FAD-dependent oxidoreductase
MAARGGQSLRVAVVGAGLGGPVAALALARAGFEPVVYEQAPSIEAVQVGAAITLWSNATRVLQPLGIGERLESVGSPVESMVFRTWRGKPLADWPVGEAARRVQAPHLSALRGRFHDAVTSELGDSVLRLGHRLQSFAQDAEGVTLRFGGGAEDRADVLVGADGLRSTVRRLLGDETSPRYAGYTSRWAAVRFDDSAIPQDAILHLWGRGMRFIAFRLGGDGVFWALVARAPEGGADEPGLKQRLLDLLDGWVAPAQAAVAATDEAQIRRQDIYDLPYRGPWTDGRVALLGDAAHAMTFDMGQGGCQAIEDGVALTDELTRASDVPAALRAYEERRRPRAEAVAGRSRRVGALSRLRNPVVVAVRERVMRQVLKRVLKVELETLSHEEVSRSR